LTIVHITCADENKVVYVSGPVQADFAPNAVPARLARIQSPTNQPDQSAQAFALEPIFGDLRSGLAGFDRTGVHRAQVFRCELG